MTSPLPKRDLIAATIVLVAAAGELGIREIYHQLSAEIPRLLMVLAVWIAVMSAAGIASRRFSPGATQGIGRIALLVALAVWLDVVGATAITFAVGAGPASVLVLSGGYAILAVGACFVVRAAGPRWTWIRRVACMASFLFVASQPIVAGVRAPVLSWPERGASASASASATGKTVTVFLLLDELNAKSAVPVVTALSKTGREVRFKELVPVADATGKVVASMFSGERFADAKPCGLYTVCSGSRVLDFSTIVASRPDVDVVGFYEPYCAMRGLRYCARLAPSSPAFDSRRWWCAALRRSTWLATIAGNDANTHCSHLGGAVWEGLVSGVEDAIWRAPVWRDGGFLYAHVPLPHPPGDRDGGSLAAHYQSNLERATRLVTRMAEEVGAQPTQQFTIVVFSDHPLRANVWCVSTQYRHNGCPLEHGLVDDKVPLIVAGDVPAAFDQVLGNIDIFRLATR